MKKDIDVSVLKDNDLDNTASFIDLMSRSQRRNREIEKKQKQEELKNILFKEDSKKVKNEKKDLKRKEALNKIARSGVEYQKFNLEVQFSKTNGAVVPVEKTFNYGTFNGYYTNYYI